MATIQLNPLNNNNGIPTLYYPIKCHQINKNIILGLARLSYFSMDNKHWYRSAVFAFIENLTCLQLRYINALYVGLHEYLRNNDYLYHHLQITLKLKFFHHSLL